MGRIPEIASLEASAGDSGRAERLRSDRFLHLSFLTSASAACEVFDEVLRQPSSGAPWCLLFDELELAPASVRQALFHSLRVPPRAMLLKLAISPYSEDFSIIAEAQGAKEGHDFDEIPLWYSEKEDGYHFASSLWRQRAARLGDVPVDATTLLGRSLLDETRDVRSALGRGYHPGSPIHRVFSDLAKKDPTFSKYLESKRILLDSMDTIPSGRRAATIRKVVHIVATREAYKAEATEKDPHSRSRLRSRKTASLYSGVPAVYALSEGNPRWLLGLMRNLVAAWRARARGSGDALDSHTQGHIILAATNRFSALLKTVQSPAHASPQRTAGLLELLDSIGETIFSAVVRERFSDEPFGTFIVDQRVDDGVLALLARALNAGALVYVPGVKDASILRTLREKRFRLSYLLAPRYRIPLRLGRPLGLAGILGREWKSAPMQTDLEFMKDSRHD